MSTEGRMVLFLGGPRHLDQQMVLDGVCDIYVEIGRYEPRIVAHYIRSEADGSFHYLSTSGERT